MKIVTTTAVLCAFLACVCLLPGAASAAGSITEKKTYEGPPAGPFKLGGLSFSSQNNMDVLRMSAPIGIAPQVFRHAIPQRIVLRFDNTQPLDNLLGLLRDKRGACVDKLEVQTLRNFATGDGAQAGVRKFSEFSTLVIAYIPDDVDARVTTDAGVVEVIFQRIRPEPTQPSPLPVNTLVDIIFDSNANKETVTFVFSAPITPSIHEVLDPHRLVMRFPSVDISVKSANQITRFMQTPLLFGLEAFNVGSIPMNYPEMDITREYHFNNYPSPLADDAYGDKVFGKQTRDAVVTLSPFENVSFAIQESDKNILKIVFTKNVKPDEPMVCTKFEPVRTQPSLLYQMENEEGNVTLEAATGEE